MSAIWNFVVVEVDSGLSFDEMHQYAAAQQRQVIEHWAPYWHTWGTVRVATEDTPATAGEIKILLHAMPGKSDPAGALGYHDQEADGTPVIHVFVALAKQFGASWTSVASHEVLEALGDPFLRLSVQMSDGFWDREVCDRVEQDTYKLDGVELSNFNTPACFEPPAALKDVKFDYLDLSKGPNEVRPGGYAQKFDTKTGWTMIGQRSAYREALAGLGLSRGARRAART